jgi:hypothetical protein
MSVLVYHELVTSTSLDESATTLPHRFTQGESVNNGPSVDKL